MQCPLVTILVCLAAYLQADQVGLFSSGEPLPSSHQLTVTDDQSFTAPVHGDNKHMHVAKLLQAYQPEGSCICG